MELYRGRLIDHIQLVVRDLAASRRFYAALFEALSIPIGGEAQDYFWADELFVSSADSRAALGVLTGVGFIGGGPILRRGDLVTGVTTGRTMWSMTMIGLAFGG
ncbi:hypothetical protein EN794_053825, partial [Mesorhizobium sp. M00.F.Ca.ET.151.01.1.1]